MLAVVRCWRAGRLGAGPRTRVAPGPPGRRSRCGTHRRLTIRGSDRCGTDDVHRQLVVLAQRHRYAWGSAGRLRRSARVNPHRAPHVLTIRTSEPFPVLPAFLPERHRRTLVAEHLLADRRPRRRSPGGRRRQSAGLAAPCVIGDPPGCSCVIIVSFCLGLGLLARRRTGRWVVSMSLAIP
jgi:hypothetical protein